MVIIFQLFYLTLIIKENDNITLTILVTPKNQGKIVLSPIPKNCRQPVRGVLYLYKVLRHFFRIESILIFLTILFDS